MHNAGRGVHTDKADASRQRRQMLQVLGLVDAMQRRAQPGQPLSECHKRRNQRIASGGYTDAADAALANLLRAKVPFHLFGHMR